MDTIAILGGGMVGRTIAFDLKDDFDVTVIDRDESVTGKLSDYPNIQTVIADISDPLKDIPKLCEPYNLIIGALPGFMGFEALKAVIELKKNVVDISFFPEDPFLLDDLAKENNVVAVVDCGIAPGLSNMILGYYVSQMDVTSFECYVGGLPVERIPPFEYKAPFSPVDVIEEYIRPSRQVENGKVVIKPALSGIEEIEIEDVGKLESFNTDGLRTLITTMNVPFMQEKTLRYPGHAKLMESIRDAGFFEREEREINGNMIAPYDVSRDILIQQWQLEPGEEEFTVMDVHIKGSSNGLKKEVNYHIYDEYEHKTGQSSMSRTTGFTCSSVMRLISKGNFKKNGIIPPEFIGSEPGLLETVKTDLSSRGIKINIS